MTQPPRSDVRNRPTRALSSVRGRLRTTLRGTRDERAASEVVGAILLFGLLISLLVLIQVNAVPAQNQQVEFEHSQRVQQDMLSLDRAILQTGTEAVPASASLELAARYPSRFFLVNPGVGAGTIETTAPGPVTVSNALAPSAPTYWNGDDRTFDTRLVRYRPNYKEYRNAPVTVYEHNTLVNTFDGGTTLPVDSGSFVDGNQVTLLLVDGQLSTASTRAVAVETTPLSAPARSLTVTNATDDGITISVPTTLSQAQWESLLEEETGPSGNVTDVVVTAGAPHDVLTVTLRPGSYNLRMGVVGVSRSTDDTVLGPYYVAESPDSVDGTLRVGESRELRVQVADRFNNPAQGEVTFTSPDGEFIRPDGSTVASITTRSDETGQASALFRPRSGFIGDAEITVGDDLDGSGTTETREELTLTVPVGQSGATDDQTDPDGVSGLNPYFADTVRLESVAPVSGKGSTVEITFYNNGSADQEIAEIRLLFYVSSKGQPAEWGRLEGDSNDQFDRLGNWETIDQTVRIEAGTPETIRVKFDNIVQPQDFFGLAVRYDETSANYFVQVPPNAKGP